MPTSIFSETVSAPPIDCPVPEPATQPVNDGARNASDSDGRWKKVVCEDCGGRGWYWAPVSIHDLVREKCEHCQGHGWHYRVEMGP